MRAVLSITIAALCLSASTRASAVEAVDNFTAFGTTENCQAPASIDGDLAAVFDEEPRKPSSLFWYDFTTQTLHPVTAESTDTRIRSVSLKGLRIAYMVRPWGSNACEIRVYDIAAHASHTTGITSAYQPSLEHGGRWFDGDRIVYRDADNGCIKIHTLSTGETFNTEKIGWYPSVDGGVIAYSKKTDVYPYQWFAAVYDIPTGQETIIEEATDAIVAGDVVAYLARRSTGELEVKYCRLSTGTIHGTGILNSYVVSTDGHRIAANPRFGPILIYDISTGAVENTLVYACADGAPCWIEISGRYVAHERWEGGTVYRGGGYPYEVIYPEADLNRDGETGADCAGGWFVSADSAPVELLMQLIDDVVALNLQVGIENALDAKLDAALSALEDLNNHNDAAARNALQAFIDAVEAQAGTQIALEYAAALIATAEAILVMLD